MGTEGHPPNPSILPSPRRPAAGGGRWRCDGPRPINSFHICDFSFFDFNAVTIICA
ncbi:hypothetical protein HMPREF1546_01151 [Oscillibacter sp. KLE 1745]|nr:hypothetical protein HMPREF1546_01151 [Oscillibacter sp. KLE 1745]